jgi:plasmid stabilization system protein ParE
MKIKKTVITEEVKKDLKEITERLDDESLHSSVRLRRAFREGVEKAVKNPEAYSLVRTKRMPNKRKQYRYIRVMKSWKLLYKLPSVTYGLLVFLGLIHEKQSDAATEARRTRKYDKE